MAFVFYQNMLVSLTYIHANTQNSCNQVPAIVSASPLEDVLIHRAANPDRCEWRSRISWHDLSVHISHQPVPQGCKRRRANCYSFQDAPHRNIDPESSELISNMKWVARPGSTHVQSLGLEIPPSVSTISGAGGGKWWVEGDAGHQTT